MRLSILKLGPVLLTTLLLHAPINWAQDEVSVVQDAGTLPESSVARNRLRAELDQLLSWLPGDYDNHEQVHFQSILDIPRDGWNLQVHYLFRRAEAPLLGPEVFFVHLFAVGSERDILGPALATYQLDLDADAIRQTNFRIREPQRVVGSDYSTLKAGDIQAQVGCDLLWRQQGGKMVGLLESPAACEHRSGITEGRPVIRRDRFVLEEDRLWSQLHWTDASGNLVFGNAMDLPFEARRAEWFQCEVNLKHATSGRAYLQRLRVHNQGGTARVMATDAALDLGFIKLRRVVWPGEDEALEIALTWHEGTNSRPAAFTLRHPDAKEIFMTHREVDIYCEVPSERPGDGDFAG